jgi:hypothetical protein
MSTTGEGDIGEVVAPPRNQIDKFRDIMIGLSEAVPGISGGPFKIWEAAGELDTQSTPLPFILETEIDASTSNTSNIKIHFLNDDRKTIHTYEWLYNPVGSGYSYRVYHSDVALRREAPDLPTALKRSRKTALVIPKNLDQLAWAAHSHKPTQEDTDMLLRYLAAAGPLRPRNSVGRLLTRKRARYNPAA